MKTCTYLYCPNNFLARGMCSKHYTHFYRNNPAKIKRINSALSNSIEYNTWRSMKKRCYLSTATGYKNYGGRGIRVCTRWYNSFTEFYNDMGKKPLHEYSIERIDNNGHYSCGKCHECFNHNLPANCKWATITEQNNNRRR